MKPLRHIRFSFSSAQRNVPGYRNFAKLWDKNLRQQGFAEAFERQRQRPG